MSGYNVKNFPTPYGSYTAVSMTHGGITYSKPYVLVFKKKPDDYLLLFYASIQAMAAKEGAFKQEHSTCAKSINDTITGRNGNFLAEKGKDITDCGRGGGKRKTRNGLKKSRRKTFRKSRRSRK
jgi:hypothetical protein